MMKTISFLLVIVSIVGCSKRSNPDNLGATSLTHWPGAKKSAISITYDDGTINQFTVARPIMNALGLPGTFYILTGKIEGSEKGKFIGREIAEIITETATEKTNKANFFERASAIGFAGSTKAVDYHSRAGSLFESGKLEEAYQMIDEGYEKLRSGELMASLEINYHNNPTDTTTWEDLKSYANEGHEIASHTVTHPRLAVLDEANLLYELEQSKQDIQKYLGEASTFSAECPYGTEDERVMEYAFELYPALRNRMPETYLNELNRVSNALPGNSDKEYVQWQRGPLSNITMDQMKSWVDTCLNHENIWLVLVFHGVDDVGWEPRTGEELQEYFGYIKAKEEHLWVATFADVTKFIRLRKSTRVTSQWIDDTIKVKATTDLNRDVYNLPLTFKTYVPASWESVVLKTDDGTVEKRLEVDQDESGNYVLYDLNSSSWEFSLYEQTM